MMNRGQVIRGLVEYRVKYWVDYRVDYQILGKFLSKKVEFLLESGEKKWVLVEYLFDYDPKMVENTNSSVRLDSTTIWRICPKYRY